MYRFKFELNQLTFEFRQMAGDFSLHQLWDTHERSLDFRVAATPEWVIIYGHYIPMVMLSAFHFHMRFPNQLTNYKVYFGDHFTIRVAIAIWFPNHSAFENLWCWFYLNLNIASVSFVEKPLIDFMYIICWISIEF